ncbi:MAG: hypothetical protein H3C58_11435, partial [Fimbriimonadaceae bacterium]|nr:hypothetical protein [Fimbriimonadaceae bacterium]
ILAVFSINSLVAVKYRDLEMRQSRQISVGKELAEALARQYGGTVDDDKKQLVWHINASGTQVARIWLNGNFLRVMYFDTPWDVRRFMIGEGEPGRIASVYGPTAQVIKKHADKLAYLFVHGMVEVGEGARDPQKLSLDRARAVHGQLQILRVIAPYTKTDVVIPATGQGRSDPVKQWIDPMGHFWVPAKYAVAYGTGSDLYLSGGPIGRVDLVLFFKEVL